MSALPPGDRRPPTSPDELHGGVRGRIGGVTRIGPRAIGAGFLIVFVLLVAILYGLNRNGNNNRAVAGTYDSPPPAPPSDEARFGANEPIVPTGAPATEPPALAVEPTSVPDLSQAQGSTAPSQAAAPAAQPQQVADTQGDARREQERLANQQARDAAMKARADRYHSALNAPILTARDPSGGQGGFAGNGATVADASGGGRASGGYDGRSQGGASGDRDSRATTSGTDNGFLNGPTGQYAVQPANISLPQGASPKDFLQSQRFAPLSPFEVVASSVIPATLITGIDSELPGLLSAQVREDVYDSRTGRYLLIPKGSRLVGLYNNDVKYGQSRVLVAWQRLIFPDTTSIDLSNMSGADVDGGSGLAGKVDNHYNKIFGAAILTSVLAAGLQLAQPQQSNVLVAPSTTSILSGSVATQIAQTGTELVRKNINVPPTIHVPKGYPFIIFVDRDMVLPGPYHQS